MPVQESSPYRHTEIHFEDEHIEVAAPLQLEILYGNAGFESVAYERRALYGSLKDLFSRMPDVTMPYKQGLELGVIDENEMVSVFQRITTVLRENQTNSRLLLYLPVQLLPTVDEYSKSEALASAEQAFVQACREAWFILLAESDVRANFIDGDVLEEGMGEPVRTRKAGHLIPDLLAHGIIRNSDVVRVLDHTSDTECIQAVAEGVIAAFGKTSTVAEEDMPDQDLPAVWDDTNRAMQEIDEKYDSSYVRTISSRRVWWERGERKNEVIEKKARILSHLLQQGTTDINQYEQLLFETDFHDHCVQLVIRSVAYAAIDIRGLVPDFLSFLVSLPKEKNVIINDELKMAMSKLVHAGVISKEQIVPYGISIPDLALPLPIDFEQYAANETMMYRQIAEVIRSDPFLSTYLYPVTLALGSKIKGYALGETDMDVAVIFKPEAPLGIRDAAMSKLRRLIPNLKDVDRIWEYWTVSDEGKIRLRHIENPSPEMIEFAQVYMLLGGVWIGDENESKHIRQDTLDNYLDLGKFGDMKDQVHGLLLRELELDVIQYRLLHKGYRRFYPRISAKPGIFEAAIDGQSDYWDPGFRRVATLLYLSRVFLPIQ